ncbi:MAG: hypothetical protein LBJ77_01470 [Holosporales bacterium]|nr:hypothetical protein [Holosporales bacterium]
MKISSLRIIAVLGVAIVSAQFVEAADTIHVPTFKERYPDGQIPAIVSRLDEKRNDEGNPFIFSSEELLGGFIDGFEAASWLWRVRPDGEFPSLEGFVEKNVEWSPVLRAYQIRLLGLMQSSDSRGLAAWQSGFIESATGFVPPVDTPRAIIQHPVGHQTNIHKYLKLAFNVGVFVGIAYTCHPEYFRGSPLWGSSSRCMD